MRNIVVLRDQLYAITNSSGTGGPPLVSISFDKANSRMFSLSQDGTIVCFSDIDDDIVPIFKSHAYLDQNSDETEKDDDWFDVNYIAGTGCIVTISHSGVIASLEQIDAETGIDSDKGLHDMNIPVVAEQIGCIDGGIATAAWSPDQSCLMIVTNNNTMLCMSSTWDVLLETPIPERLAPGATGKYYSKTFLYQPNKVKWPLAIVSLSRYINDLMTLQHQSPGEGTARALR